MSTLQRVSCVFSAVIALIVPTLLLAQDKSAVLDNCKLTAFELYSPFAQKKRPREGAWFAVVYRAIMPPLES